jgi:hypothetical protein
MLWLVRGAGELPVKSKSWGALATVANALKIGIEVYCVWCLVFHNGISKAIALLLSPLVYVDPIICQLPDSISLKLTAPKEVSSQS